MHSIVVFCLILSISTIASAECFMNCVFQKGTKCVNNECVPVSVLIPTPTGQPVPTSTDSQGEIQLELVPVGNTTINTIDCSKLNMKNIKLTLKRKTPPPGFTYFYSGIFLTQKDKTDFYMCRKDLLNKYVFILANPTDKIVPQFYGPDFVFNMWTNTAFNELLSSKTCAELKASDIIFNCGFATNEDRTDYESATFIFK